MPPIQKADLKILVLGGSYAWGFGAYSNETTPTALIAKKFSRELGIATCGVNLADQAYCSIQEIKSFVFSVDELQPDLVVCITGVNDVGRGRLAAFKREPRYVAYSQFLSWGIRVGLLGQFTMAHIPSWKKAAKILLRDHASQGYPDQDYFSFTKPSRDAIPLTLLEHKVNVLSSFCETRGIMMVFVLQPMLHFKKSLSGSEETFLSLVRKAGDSDTISFYKNHISLMKKWFVTRPSTTHVSFVDSTTFFDEHPETVFFDGMHVSDHGYQVWVDELWSALATTPNQ